MISWRRTIVRGICTAMSGNPSSSLSYQQQQQRINLDVSGLIRLILITFTTIRLITLITLPQVDAVKLPLQSASGLYHATPRKALLFGTRSKLSSSIYADSIQRLRDLTAERRKKSDHLKSQDHSMQILSVLKRDKPSNLSFHTSNDHFNQFMPSFVAISDDHKQQIFHNKLNMLTSSTSPVPSLPNIPKSVYSHDCSIGNCLLNNGDNFRLLHEAEVIRTKEKQLSPQTNIFPASNSKSNNEDTESDFVPDQSSLRTDLKTVRRKMQSSRVLEPVHALSYYELRKNFKNDAQYGDDSKVISSISKTAPPFAGGAELTDFIQPIETTTQFLDTYEKSNTNSEHLIALSDSHESNKYQMIRSPESRRTYASLQSPPRMSSYLPAPEIYIPVKSSFTIPEYSNYDAHRTEHFTQPPTYTTNYEPYTHVCFNFYYR
ncbi:unnamed protein product [Thelazia callipaeda]|uniref:Uncharacterized protein n=1 Tax=Thelazia callipaeda TaxID=103827 RepID=A0A0N5CW99_THECL|nr:unnamed protein product [Thelazia callipaeda]